MGEPFLQPGNFYLFACPWDWTFVGEYVRHENLDEIVIRNGGYFTRPGDKFGTLSVKGFTKETKFHPTEGGHEQLIPAQGPKWRWIAKTPWVREGGQQ